jgi:ABC-type branched-subunit amino acid transport system ATPase component
MHHGAIRWKGVDVSRRATHLRARAGIGWVPQERRMWPSLTVDEHLSAVAAPGEWTLEQLRVVRGNIPVVITSGFQAEDASKLLRMPNVVGFLDKPHTMTSLEMLLASAPRHTRRVEASAASALAPS